MTMFFFWCAIGIVAGVLFGSFFEWTLHRYIMHHSVKWFRYPFERHALVHHRIFKADHTYHLVNEPDKKTIPMAWWAGPAIVAACQLPFLIWALFSHKWGVLCGAEVAFAQAQGPSVPDVQPDGRNNLFKILTSVKNS